MSFTKTAELLAQELSCPVCLQLFSEPVTLPCGHNFCLSCIQKAMDVEKDRHYCPECRAEYVGGGDLQRNPKLNSIVEGYKAVARTGAGIRVSVMCDHCLGIGTPAVTTCLKCEISLCPQHLQRHTAKESFRSHPLVEPPMPDLGFRSCVVHNKRLEYFCASDGAFLCSSCFIEGSHQDHDIQTFESAGAELRRILDTQTRKVRDKLQMVDCLLLRAMEDTGIFTAAGGRLEATAMTLLSGMEDLVRNFRSCLSQQLAEEQGGSQASWQASIDKMTGQHSALKEVQEQAKCILLEPDECLFVHQFLWLKPRLAKALDTAVNMPAPAVLNERRLSVSARTDDFKTEMNRLVQDLHNLLNPLKLMFNPNTAHPSLVLSKDLRTVKYSATKQAYPEHPERFLTVPQVLCSQGFSSGEHVWVVEVGNCLWSLGVCYSHIPRKGDQSRLGHNQLSWRLQWKNKKLTACHASSHMTLQETTPLLRVEVSLDYEGGRLSFHSLVGHRVHLHTFRTIFREMVYPAFCVHSTTPESWITIQG